MITIRSLLPDALTAFCTELKRHLACRRSLMPSSSVAFLLESLVIGWLGRSRKPSVRALVIDARARRIDVAPPLPWQTTRTSARGLVFAVRLPVNEGSRPLRPAGAAEASERATGRPPPAAGEIDLSGLGSGQYEGLSRWACAAPVKTSARTVAAMPASKPLAIRSPPNRWSGTADPNGDAHRFIRATAPDR